MTTSRLDELWINANLATLARSGPYGAVQNGAIGWRDGVLQFVGTMRELPEAMMRQSNRLRDAGGRWVTPGLIDCHTHAVFAGNRAEEFEQRLAGRSYAQIAAAGGGIMRSMSLTRAAGVQALVRSAKPRLDALIDDGVTTLEVKSGYGLTLDAERDMLLAAGELARALPVAVQRTFLGLHALPPEYREDRAAFVSLVICEWLPKLHALGLIDAVDAFCEHLAFSVAECARFFAAAQALGIPRKLHAEQLSHLGGSVMAASFGALSVDHVEYLEAAEAAALKRAGTVAVLLPAAYVVLRETKLPPIAALRAAGVPMAVATDLNPGTSPVQSLRTAMNLACSVFGLTPEESLAGASQHAAAALGLRDRGQLQCGMRADLCLWNIEHPSELSYWWGGRLLCERVFEGRPDGRWSAQA